MKLVNESLDQKQKDLWTRSLSGKNNGIRYQFTFEVRMLRKNSTNSELLLLLSVLVIYFIRVKNVCIKSFWKCFEFGENKLHTFRMFNVWYTRMCARFLCHLLLSVEFFYLLLTATSVTHKSASIFTKCAFCVQSFIATRTRYNPSIHIFCFKLSLFCPIFLLSFALQIEKKKKTKWKSKQMQMQVNHSVLLAFFEFSRTHFSSFFFLHICTTALKSILMLELLLDFWICLSNFSNKTFISWVPEHRFILYQM